MVGVLKEIWFYVAAVGMVNAGFFGWTSRYENRRGKLKSRNNQETREKIYVATAVIVSAVIFAETFWRVASNHHSVIAGLFSEEIFYEMIIFPIFLLVGYSVLLFAIDVIAEIMHIGIHQIRKEYKERSRIEEEEAYARQKEAEKKALQRAIILGIAESRGHSHN